MRFALRSRRPTLRLAMQADSSIDIAPARSAAVAARGSAASASRAALPFVAGSAVLGTIGVFVHAAAADPLTATWFRCAFGLLALTAWLLWRGQLGALRLRRRALAPVLLASVLLLASWALFFAAIERISTAMAVVLFHVQPFWVLLLGAWLFGAAVSRRRLAATCAAMAGLALATGLVLGTPGSEGGPPAGYWTGVAWCLVGALCMAGVTLAAKQLADLPAGVLAWWQCAIGAAALWVFPAASGWPTSGASWAWLSGLGLVHTGLAYSLLYAGIARLNTDRIAALQFVYPAVAIIVDRLYFGLTLSSVQLLGVALMAAAVWFAESERQRNDASRLRRTPER